ncbi:MAG: glycosyltransferase [Sphingobacteriales bacterium]|nr:MAG: glycosyltransferase [Sphingobacteriales bacterium]
MQQCIRFMATYSILPAAMIALYYTTLFLLAAYTVLLLYYARWWQQTPVYKKQTTKEPVAVTVIVPARNEAANIKACLQSLLNQQYPHHLLQIIVVNDQSEDATATIVKNTAGNSVLLLTTDTGFQTAPKKRAIEKAITHATGELIITTDADCITPNSWVATLVDYYQQTGAVFIAAPVNMAAGKSLVSIFQTVDFLTMQGITAGVVHRRFTNMCNGANLAYTKKAFEAVGGFKNIDAIASGDDMLLMHKIANHFPGKVGFIKSENATVTTLPVNSWKAFLQQRIRWASKATHYKEQALFAVLLLVYCCNFSMLILIVTGLLINLWWLVGAFVFIKFFAELLLVGPVLKFFKQKKLWPWLLLLQPLHIVYIIMAGFLGQVKTYHWKGRRLK